MKKIISLLICFILAFGTLPAFAEENVTYSNEDIVKEVAYAYFHQGNQIQYDQTLRVLTASPEDATAQKRVYLDCSSFVNSCYMEAFGVNVMPYERDDKEPVTRRLTSYAKDNPSNPDVVGYWEPANYTTEEQKAALMNEVRGLLRVGDVIVYTREKDLSGHTMMYVGDDMFLHSTGSDATLNRMNAKAPLSYDNSTTEDVLGTVRTLTADEVFSDKESTRYLFIEDPAKKVLRFCVLRPIARGLTPTKEALSRMNMQGLSMEKVCSVSENNAVNTGDIITFTIELKNTSDKDLTNIVLEDTLTPGTEFVSGGQAVNCEEGKISWTGTVNAGKTAFVKYSVKVTETVPGTLLVNDSTYVGGVKLGKITHTLSGIGKREKLELVEYAEKIVGKNIENPLLVADEIYGKNLGIDIFSEYATVSEALEEILLTYTGGIAVKDEDKTALAKTLVPTLYGGHDIRKVQPTMENIDQTRVLSEEELEVGDVILANIFSSALGKGNKIGETVFIYLGDSTLLTVENGVAKTVNIGLDIYGSDSDNVLFALNAYSKFAVVRPSMAVWGKEMNYADVSRADWFYPYVNFVTSRNLIAGKNGKFAPNENLTRAALVEALYNMEGNPAVTSVLKFTDVKADATYKNAVLWATENGIVNGVTETEFAPEAHITREQLATIIYRYAKFNNTSYKAGSDDKLASFGDAASIAEYAKEGVLYAVENGILSGFEDSTMRPQGNTTRAQAAAIVNRVAANFGCANPEETYKLALSRAEKFFEDVSDYKYEVSFVNEFKAAYENNKKQATGATPSQLSAYAKELNTYLNESIYYQTVSYENIDIYGKSWSNSAYGTVTDNEDGSVTFTPGEGQNSYSIADMNNTDAVLAFQIKYDVLPSSKWRGIYFNMSDKGRGNNVIIKHNQLEYQSIDATLTALPNFAVEGEKWITFEIGAVNTPTGVMQYWKIDGNVVFAKIDQNS